MKKIAVIVTLLVALLTTAIATTETVDVERDALMVLYDSTNGPNWRWNTGWGVGDPCDMAWYGVTCDSGHVQVLDLWQNLLSGPIPPELGNLSRLERLSLGNNQLSGPIPPELGSLSSLKRLVLRGSQLTGNIPAELGNLSSLELLYLNTNQLSGSIPAELGNLSSLRFLDLSINQLTGNIPAELGNLSSLFRLELFNNYLSGTIPAELSNLSSLGTLDLWHMFSADPPDPLCWQTEEALNWATSGELGYDGPDVVCQPELVYLPVVVSAGG